MNHIKANNENISIIILIPRTTRKMTPINNNDAVNDDITPFAARLSTIVKAAIINDIFEINPIYCFSLVHTHVTLFKKIQA